MYSDTYLNVIRCWIALVRQWQRYLGLLISPAFDDDVFQTWPSARHRTNPEPEGQLLVVTGSLVSQKLDWNEKEFNDQYGLLVWFSLSLSSMLNFLRADTYLEQKNRLDLVSLGPLRPWRRCTGWHRRISGGSFHHLHKPSNPRHLEKSRSGSELQQGKTS